MDYIDFHTHNISKRKNIFSVFNIEAGSVFIPESYFSMGIHPWYIKEEDLKKQYEQFRQLSSLPVFIMIGECGLDKHCATPFGLQKEVFEKQIELSEELKKPLIIHCVRSYNEIIEYKKHYSPRQPWTIHGFRGNRNVTDSFLKEGLYLSFGRHYNPESLQITPFERLFIETDDSEHPISEIYSSIAKARKISIEELKEIVFSNVKNILPEIKF